MCVRPAFFALILLTMAACAQQAPVPSVEHSERSIEPTEGPLPTSMPPAPQPTAAIEPAASTRSMLPQRRAASEPAAVQSTTPPTPAVTRAPTPEVLVVVLPEADGKVGTVRVESEGETKVLNTAYASAHVTSTGAISASNLDGVQVRDEFRAALAALPERPASYLVWFVEGQDEPTADSRKELKRILE